jgi:hypothetical protein
MPLRRLTTNLPTPTKAPKFIKLTSAPPADPAGYRMAYRLYNSRTGDYSAVSPITSNAALTQAFRPTVIKLPASPLVDEAVELNPTNPEVRYQLVYYIAGVPYVAATGGVVVDREYSFSGLTNSQIANPTASGLLGITSFGTVTEDTSPLPLGTYSSTSISTQEFTLTTDTELSGLVFWLTGDSAEVMMGHVAVSILGVTTNTSKEEKGSAAFNGGILVGSLTSGDNILPVVCAPGSKIRLRVTLTNYHLSPGGVTAGDLRLNYWGLGRSYPVEPNVMVPHPAARIIGDCPLNTFYTGLWTIASGKLTLQREFHLTAFGRYYVLPKDYSISLGTYSPTDPAQVLTFGLDGAMRVRPVNGFDPLLEVAIFSNEVYLFEAFVGRLQCGYATQSLAKGATLWRDDSGKFTTNPLDGVELMGVTLSGVTTRGDFSYLSDGVCTALPSVTSGVICASSSGSATNFVTV